MFLIALVGSSAARVGTLREIDSSVRPRRELDSSLWLSRVIEAFAKVVGRKVVRVEYLLIDLAETDGRRIARASIDFM
jgi:hypothetical protein